MKVMLLKIKGNVISANKGQINMVAAKSKKDGQTEGKGSLSEIKQDNVEATRKQESKNKNRSN
ncbi:MAG: hypothetical protein WBZ36_08050 [Candidatus Nitrosopolaris sp.]